MLAIVITECYVVDSIIKYQDLIQYFEFYGMVNTLLEKKQILQGFYLINLP
jgi:hypothetical protein